MENRISFIDTARGIGIILMVWGHVDRGLRAGGLVGAGGPLLFINDTIYLFHMPLFFVVSGYLMGRSKKKPSIFQQFKNNSWNILIPYFLWKNLFNLTKIIFPAGTNLPAQALNVAGFILPSAHFWFLSTLFLAKTVSGFVSRNANLVLFGLSVIAYLTLPNPFGWATGMVFFALGRILGDFGILSAEYYKKYTVWITILSTIIFASLAWFFWLKWESGALELVAASAGVALTFGISNKLNIKWLAYIGANTMVIYLLHTFATAAFRILVVRLFGIESAVLHLIGGTLIGLVAPLIFLWVVKRLSIRKYVFVG